MKRTASMADVVKPLSECPSQAYLSNAVQVADLLEWILKQVEQFASIYLKISDMAVILDIPAERLREDIANRSTEVSKCYHRGKAASKVKLLHQEMQLAYVGSPLALETAQKNLMDMEDDE